VYGGTIDSTGAAAPSNYSVTLNSAVVGHVVRRVDAITLPSISAPPAPTGTHDVSLSSGQTVSDFTTLRNLSLNSRAGQVVVPPGTYGAFTASSNSGFTLGVVGATEPAVYNLQGLTLNKDSQIVIVGPVILRIASGVTINSGNAGNATHPSWLTLNVAAGSVTLNGTVNFAGVIVAPTSTVTLSGGTTLTGSVTADRLTINGGGELNLAP
jgi:hypothetical protein